MNLVRTSTKREETKSGIVNIKKNQSEMKNTLNGIKNTLQGINSGVDEAEDEISNL